MRHRSLRVLSSLYATIDDDLSDVAIVPRRMKETTAADVARESGPAFAIPAKHERYVTFAVSGWSISPGTTGRPASKTWTVLDSQDCWREVETFEPAGRATGQAQAQAEKLARELNAADARKIA